MKALERGAPAVAILAALSALFCCLPFGLVGSLGFAFLSVWLAPLRPWLLGAAFLLLIMGFWQLYRSRNHCKAKPSIVSVTVFWGAVVVVLLVTLFPQLVANWIAR